MILMSVLSSAWGGKASCFQSPEGFLWYNEKPFPTKEKEERHAPALAETLPAVQAKARNEGLKQRLEDAIQILLDRPSLEHAILAQRLQKEVMDRGEMVAEAWGPAALLDAGILDMKDNPNNLHRVIAKEQKVAKDQEVLKKKAATWGLVVFVQPQCPWCTKFIPILQDLKERFGFQILAISKEGGAYGPFPGGRDDHGMIGRFNPQGFAPLLFMVSRDGQHIYPIAKGLTDLEKIQENILLILKLREKGHV